MAAFLLARSASKLSRELSTRSLKAACVRSFGAASQQGATAENPTYEVPAGHAQSDLSSTACNIGLNRRRDLTMRQDVRIFVDGAAKSIGDVFKGHTSVFFGVPDMGRVCSEQHAPGYVKQADALKKLGVGKVWTVAVADCKDMEAWAKKIGLDTAKVGLLSDKTGAFARMLGVELIPSASSGAKTQRYAGLVEDGILIKLRVEDALADVKKSSAEAMLEVIKELKALQ